MANSPSLEIAAASAAEICARFDLEEKARPVLRDWMGPGEFVEALVANRQYAAGIDFVAHALPARQAIWWACLCVQHACGNNLAPPDKAAARAAVQWVLRPTEQNRAAAKAPAEAARAPSPAGALAMAASLTGGNLGPPNLPPARHLPGQPTWLRRLSLRPSKWNRPEFRTLNDYSSNWGSA